MRQVAGISSDACHTTPDSAHLDDHAIVELSAPIGQAQKLADALPRKKCPRVSGEAWGMAWERRRRRE